MLDTTELSAESQAKLADVTASAIEFFDKIARLTRTVDDLTRHTAALEARLVLVETTLVRR